MRFNGIIPYSRVSLGSLTVTAANETLRAKTPTGVASTVLQRYKLSAVVSTNEVWRPVGLTYIVGTDIAAAAAVVQLLKNGVAPNGPSATLTANGIATLAAAVAGPDEVFVPFTDYTFLAADAAGDVWSVLVTTVADTTGIVTSNLIYVTAPKLTVTDLTI